MEFEIKNGLGTVLSVEKAVCAEEALSKYAVAHDVSSVTLRKAGYCAVQVKQEAE